VRVVRSFHVITVAGLAGVVASTTATGAAAEPQASVGLTVGAALEDVVGPRSVLPALHLGGRGELLLFRSNPRQMGFGPYLDVATAGFENVDAGGGVSWLVPLVEDVPVVLSGGAFARNGQERSWAPGVEGTLFAGSHSYNFHSWYAMAVGFFAQSRWVPASPATFDVVLGVQLDAELLVLPALFVMNALR
jgi:hypothetical protein